MIGVDTQHGEMPPVTGQAKLTVGLEGMDGEARFTDFKTTIAGNSDQFRTGTLSYENGIEGNSFHDENGYLEGALYGPQHEELGGTLSDESPAVGLEAVFSGTKTANN